MNVQSRFDQWCDAIDQVMRETGTRSRMDAAEFARRRYPHLANARPDESSPSYSGAANTGGTAEAQLDALARDLSRQMHITFAKAYVQVLNSNPALYVAYLREHEAALGARRG